MQRARTSGTKYTTPPRRPVRQDFIVKSPPLADCRIRTYSTTAPTRVPELAGACYFGDGPSGPGCSAEGPITVGSLGEGVVTAAGLVLVLSRLSSLWL